MKITSTNYKQKFPTFQFLNCDIGFEGTLGENEDPLNALKQLKTIAEAFHKQEFPHLYNDNQQPNTSETPVQYVFNPTPERTIEEVIQAHITTINECRTLRNLEMFANMVQRENSQELFDAYNQKKKQLQ